MKTENENKVVNFFKSNNEHFVKACAEVLPPYGKKPIFNTDSKQTQGGIPVTKRQAAKWLRKEGIAYKTHKGVA
jgi:hypothetical protein